MWSVSEDSLTATMLKGPISTAEISTRALLSPLSPFQLYHRTHFLVLENL